MYKTCSPTEFLLPDPTFLTRCRRQKLRVNLKVYLLDERSSRATLLLGLSNHLMGWTMQPVVQSSDRSNCLQREDGATCCDTHATAPLCRGPLRTATLATNTPRKENQQATCLKPLVATHNKNIMHPATKAHVLAAATQQLHCSGCLNSHSTPRTAACRTTPHHEWKASIAQTHRNGDNTSQYHTVDCGMATTCPACAHHNAPAKHHG